MAQEATVEYELYAPPSEGQGGKYLPGLLITRARRGRDDGGRGRRWGHRAGTGFQG